MYKQRRITLKLSDSDILPPVAHSFFECNANALKGKHRVADIPLELFDWSESALPASKRGRPCVGLGWQTIGYSPRYFTWAANGAGSEPAYEFSMSQNTSGSFCCFWLNHLAWLLSIPLAVALHCNYKLAVLGDISWAHVFHCQEVVRYAQRPQVDVILLALINISCSNYAGIKWRPTRARYTIDKWLWVLVFRIWDLEWVCMVPIRLQ